jgi:uncharacterized protein YprB with RNaseH-like and TPR domain
MRIVGYDIETTDLSALMGRILCCSFYPIVTQKGVGGKPYTLRADDKRFRSDDIIDDSKLVAAIRDELEKYHLIVGWNSKLFDLPFINARLAKAGERILRPQLHLDAMWFAGGNSMRIGSKKLVNVQKYFKLGEEKTDITWEQWQRAAALDRRALDEVVHHCEQDVKVLNEAYWKLISSVANIHR